MHEYNKSPSEFEVQSLAFGILRKNLYPAYHIRGEYKFPTMRADIAIFKNSPDGNHQPVLLLEVKKSPTGESTSQGKRYESVVGVPCLYIRGYQEAYKVMELVHPYLT